MSDHKTFDEAYLAAQMEMQNPAKSHTAKVPTRNGGEFSYNYASLEDTLAEVKPVLNKHGIALVMPCVSDESVVGTGLQLRGYGTVVDLGTLVLPTNPDPQKVGATETYLRRYILGALGIVAEEDTDANTVTHATPSRVESEAAGRQEVKKAVAAAAPIQADASAGSYKVAFGKHKGLSIAEIAAEDIGWLKWLTTKAELKDYNKTAIAKATAYLASLEVPAPTEGPLAEAFPTPGDGDEEIPF
jgi:hypothetical protein